MLVNNYRCQAKDSPTQREKVLLPPELFQRVQYYSIHVSYGIMRRSHSKRTRGEKTTTITLFITKDAGNSEATRSSRFYTLWTSQTTELTAISCYPPSCSASAGNSRSKSLRTFLSTESSSGNISKDSPEREHRTKHLFNHKVSCDSINTIHAPVAFCQLQIPSLLTSSILTPLHWLHINELNMLPRPLKVHSLIALNRRSTFLYMWCVQTHVEHNLMVKYWTNQKILPLAGNDSCLILNNTTVWLNVQTSSWNDDLRHAPHDVLVNGRLPQSLVSV